MEGGEVPGRGTDDGQAVHNGGTVYGAAASPVAERDPGQAHLDAPLDDHSNAGHSLCISWVSA